MELVVSRLRRKLDEAEAEAEAKADADADAKAAADKDNTADAAEAGREPLIHTVRGFGYVIRQAAR